MKDLLSISQAATLLNISKSTLYKWAELRKIPSVKLGRCVRFDIADVEKWINENRVEAF